MHLALDELLQVVREAGFELADVELTREESEPPRGCRTAPVDR